jgi:LmbE family N-acetylglucosaminyl deacetylase
MMKFIMTLAFILCVLTSFAQTGKKFLIVVAHPDDETALAEVLVKYRRLGNIMQLMIATDGKDGTRVTSIPAGDSLGNLRKLESACACKTMGIPAPIFLGIDRLDTRHGVGKYFDSHRHLLEMLKVQVPAFDPDFILTFGPDGDTHHSEHIVIGAAITELLLMEGWVDRYPLYYIAWNQQQGKLFDLGFVNEKYFNVRITYSQEDENEGLKIMPCYKTQYTADELKTDFEKKQNDKTNVLNFRKFEVAKGFRDSFK